MNNLCAYHLKGVETTSYWIDCGPRAQVAIKDSLQRMKTKQSFLRVTAFHLHMLHCMIYENTDISGI